MKGTHTHCIHKHKNTANLIMGPVGEVFSQSQQIKESETQAGVKAPVSEQYSARIISSTSW